MGAAAQGLMAVDTRWGEPLHLQKLQRIELIEPWRGSTSQHCVLAGGIVLRFENLAVICSSPLRYMRSQVGTSLGLNSQGQLLSLGLRCAVAPHDVADATLSMGRHRQSIQPRKLLLDESNDGLCAPPVLLLTAISEVKQGWALSMRFLGGWYQLAYRLDLDGAIEFAPRGQRHDLKHIEVDDPTGEFGWLHPASPHPFALNGQYWRSAHPRDWPWPLRKAHACAADVRHEAILTDALQAKFDQHPELHRRLQALQIPVMVNGVPDAVLLNHEQN